MPVQRERARRRREDQRSIRGTERLGFEPRGDAFNASTRFPDVLLNPLGHRSSATGILAKAHAPRQATEPQPKIRQATSAGPVVPPHRDILLILLSARAR